MNMLASCLVGVSVAAASLLSPGGQAESITIGAGAKVPIVVPKDSISSERTALAELVEYVGKATGVKLEAVSEEKAPAGPAIHLGATAFARQAVPDLDKFGAEEWTVKTAGGCLVIAGGRPRGVLYGVYHFLEDVVGVRWLTQLVEHVPSRPQLRLGELDLRGRPAMPYRSIYIMPGKGAAAFMARNRMCVAGVQYGGGKMFGGSGDCHTLYTNLGDTNEIRRLYKEHPDWFPLIDGKRKCDVGRANSAAQSQLCLTNPELRKYWIGKMRERIRADRVQAEKAGVPPPRYYAIDQNDCYDGFCKCEACAAIAAREESNAGILLDFANHVAEVLEPEAPGAMFQMMALHSTEKPPKYLKGRANVTVRLCDTTSNLLVPWTDPQNAKHLNNLKAWVGHADSISMWDYQITYGAAVAVCQPTPAERTFAADIRMLRDCKGDGFFFEHECPVAADMRDLKVWLEFKLVENPDLDGEKLIREFTDLYYGPAAGAEVRKCRDILGAAADAAKARVGWFPSLSNYSFITAETLLACYRCFDAALAAVKGDPEKTARVEHAFMSVDRYCLSRAVAMRRQLEKAGGNASMLPAVQDVADRYRRVFDREAAARGLDSRNDGRKKAIDEFFSFVGKARELPVPERFRDVPRDALFLIPSTFASTWYRGMKFVDDSSSPAGRALTANMGLVLKNPHKYYPMSAYNWPLKGTVWPTMDGTKTSVFGEIPEKQPEGYHWYLVGKDLKLKPESVISLWNGAYVPLDGVVCDNSELGQKYDVYASVKIEGGDVYTTGKATPSTVYYVDQVAVVRKTLNSETSAAQSPDVVRVEKAPVVDGKLDDAAWASAKWQTGFRRFAREKRREVKSETAFSVVADDENLYIGVKCFEPDMARLATPGEANIFSKSTDFIEVDFCPDGTPFEHYQFAFAQRGDTYAMFYSEGGNIRPDPYGPKFEHAVGTFEGGWTVEVRLPLSALYMTREQAWKDEWTFNVARGNPVEGPSSWSDLGAPGEGFQAAKKYRRMTGFPRRRPAEDVWVKSAVAHVKGKVADGLSGSLELLVAATVPGEVSVETTFGSAKSARLVFGDATIVIPAKFPEGGRIPCDIAIARADGSASLGRTYPVMVDYTPMAISFSSPGYRSNFYPGQNADRVAGAVRTSVPGEVRLTLEGPGFPRREATLPEGGGPFAFDTKGFAYGEALLTVTVGGETFTKKVRRIAPRTSGHMTWVENGNLMLDGKPIFRRNMYAEHYRGGEAFNRRYDADDLHQTLEMKRIATLEPNRVIPGLERREATRDVVPCEEYFARIDKILEKGAVSPDGAYYYISDEPECRGMSPVYLRHVYEHAIEKDPYHVILTGTRGGLKYLNCADWFETHPYVHQRVDAKGRRTFGRGLLELGPFVDAFRAAEHLDKCVGCVPTCFAYPDGVAPTFREYVTHTWNFLVHGAKSFFPYAHHDLGDTPMTYEGVRFTNMTAERLSDFFLFGRRTPLKCPAGSEGAVWELDGKRLFAIVNATFEPLEATVPGLDGRYVEFRGPRTFDCRAAGTKFSLKPLEALVATSEKMDAGLPTYDEAEKKVLALDALRTGRDNQLKSRRDDILVNGHSRHWTRKLVDGTLDVLSWQGRIGRDTPVELTFVGFVPTFRELKLYGANISNATVSVLSGGEWIEPEAETETAEFSKFFRFGRTLRTVKLRIGVTSPKHGTLELYEIEMPACGETPSAGSAAAAKVSLEPKNALWRVSGPTALEGSFEMKIEGGMPPEAKWLVFELAEAERLNAPKYSAWSLRAGKKRSRKLAGDVTNAQKGLYTLPVSPDYLKDGRLRLLTHNCKVTVPFVALAAEPEQRLSFREEDGKWKFELRLAAPCEDVTCSLYGNDGHAPVPYPVGASGKNVAMKPDASRRLWTAEIPAQPIAAARNGKQMHPWAKATVLGGSLTMPAYTPLVSASPRAFD